MDAAALALLGLLLASQAASEPAAPAERELGGEYPAFVAPPSSNADVERPTYEEPHGELLLPAALGLALLHNPDLASFSWEIRVQEAKALQAGLFPNTELVFEMENFGGSGPYRGYDSGETTIALGQLVELAGKRGKRRRLAELDRDLSGWDYEVQRLDVLTSVTQKFVGVLEAQQRLALADEILAIATASFDAVTLLVEAGAASSVEVTRASVSVSSAGVQRRRAEAALAVARSRLAAQWGARTAAFDRALGDLGSVSAPPVLEWLQRRIDDNPDVARWVTELAQRDAVVALEDAQRIPDVEAAVGIRRYQDTNDTAMIFGLTVPIPIFDRNQGARRAARYGRTKARSEQRAAGVRAASSLAIAHQELLSSFDEVDALRRRVLPQARQAFEGVNTGYLRGLFRYVDVLDAQRTLFELRDRELVALGSFHRATAEIERLTGAPIQVVDSGATR